MARRVIILDVMADAGTGQQAEINVCLGRTCRRRGNSFAPTRP
jgi:hypothetical protein